MVEKLKPEYYVGLTGYPETRMPDSAQLMRKINELVDAVNTIQTEREAERFEIQEWIGILEAVRKSVNIHEKQIDKLQMKVEPEKCKTPSENVQTDVESRPENVQKIDIGELAYLQKENSDLKDEVELLQKQLKTAVSALKYIQDGNLGFSPAMDFAEKALEQITAEQKD